MKKIIFSNIISVFLIAGQSYDDELTGIVLDAQNNKPISDVNIFIPDQQIGATTDQNGSFVIKGQLVFPIYLQISHIGYQSINKVIDAKPEEILTVYLTQMTIEMDELVVTATRSRRFRNEAPIATEVISRTDIENSGSRNVAELLSQRAGVSLQTSVAGGSILNVLGMDSRYILILVDGQPVTGKFNNRVSLDQILTDQLSRVEIVKGPSSSLYGSEAMGGVINIITDKNKKSPEINVSSRYGNTQNNFNDSGLKNGSSNLGLNFVQPLNDVVFDLQVNVEQIQKDKSVQELDIDQVQKITALGNINWKLNDRNKINFKSNFYDQADNGSTKLMNTNTDIDRINLSVSHQTNFQKGWNINQTLLSNNYSRNYVQQRPWGKLERDDLTSEDHLEYEILFNKKSQSDELNAGFEIYRANYSSDRINSGKQEINSKSVFGQYDIKMQNKINMIFGARFDDYSAEYRVLSPRLGLMYKISEKWKFRTSWGQGFRAPSFLEKYIDWNNVQFNYLIEGNPNLKPERSNGITVGFDYNRSSGNQFNFVYYYTDFENLIQDYNKSKGVLSYQNINAATFSGFEVSHLWRLSKRLEYKWTLNWSDNRDEKGNPIPNTIPFSVSGYLNFNFFNNLLKSSVSSKWVAPYKPQEFDIKTATYISSEEKISGYAIINIRTTMKIKESINLSLVLDNVGNYTNDNFGPFVGRAVYLELSTALTKKDIK